MNELTFRKVKEGILPADDAVRRTCRARWNSIAKPLHSLGWMEDAVIRAAAASRNAEVRMDKKALVVFCADNGIVEEGVTQTGQEVTAIVAGNFASGMTCTSLMCERAGASLLPVDIGMKGDAAGVENRKIRRGTRNFAKEPAMTEEETIRAIETGISLAVSLKEKGYDLLAAGEMGIGNTTTSAAVISAILKLAPEDTTGRGAGLSDERLQHKISVIREALSRYRLTDADPLKVLSCVGGFDIAGMTGFYLGSAYARVPVVLDGIISCAAALTAVRLAPASADYMIASHVSREKGAQKVLDECRLRPVLDAGMFLGEGSGAAAVFPLLDMAAEVYHRMGTFEDIHVDAYEEYGVTR